MLTKVTRYVVHGALFIIPFLVLYVADGSLFGINWFFPFITGKGFLFRIIVEVAFTGWVVLACVDHKYRPKFSWTGALYVALVAWMFIADAFAMNPHKAFWSNFERMDGYVTLIHVFLLFVVAGSVLEADKLWRKWWQTFLWSSVILLGYSFLQLSHLIPIHQGGARVDGTLGNAAYLAAYLLFVIAVGLWQGLESKGWLRWVWFVLVACDAFVLYETATRGAILGALGAVVLAAFLWMFQSGKKGKKYAAGALVVVVLVVGGFLALRQSAFVLHDPTLARFATISSEEGTTRFTLWHMALEGAAARPLTGWGQEGFNYVFNTYYEPSLYGQEPWFDRAHNIYFDWLIGGGFPALLLFLALLGSAMFALFRSTDERSERILLIVALGAYAFQGLFVFDNLFTYIPLAIVFAMAHARSARPIKKLEALPKVTRSATVLASTAVVIGIIVVWVVNVPNILAASDLLTALSGGTVQDSLNSFKSALARHSFGDQEIREQLVTFAANVAGDSNSSAADKAASSQLAIEEMGKEVAILPKDTRLRLEDALAYRTAGDFKGALVQDKAAEALSPKKQGVLVDEGLALWQSGDTAGARDAFNRAYNLDTSFTDLAVYAAAGDIATGNMTTGKKLLTDVYGTTTVDNNVLILAYFQVKDYDNLINSVELNVRDHDSIDTRVRLIAAYKEAGRIQDARQAVHDLVAKYPETAQAAAAYLAQLGG